MEYYETYIDEEDYKDNQYLIGKITTDLIQAINRIRCRKVIDTEGNCEAANIYLYINNNNLYRNVISDVVKLMSGINVIECKGDKEAISRDEKKLVEYLITLNPGQHDIIPIQEGLGIATRTMNRILKKLKEPSGLKQTLEQYNITYQSKAGKGGYKRFIRADK